MKNSIIFAATAACALSVGLPAAAQTVVTSGAAVHNEASFPGRDAKAKVLYNQLGHGTGGSILSQKFEAAFAIDDSQAADDFTVPTGKNWTVSEVDVVGYYSAGGGGVATSENVFFYKTAKGLPGAKVATLLNVKGTDTKGSFAIKLPKTVKLSAGTYFVSVQINMPFNGSGGPTEWSWGLDATGSKPLGNPAVFENPNNGLQTGCTKYTVQATCGAAGVGTGQLFSILGQTLGK